MERNSIKGCEPHKILKHQSGDSKGADNLQCKKAHERLCREHKTYDVKTTEAVSARYDPHLR